MVSLAKAYGIAFKTILGEFRNSLDEKTLTEAKPHFADMNHTLDFCQSMQHLNFSTHELKSKFHEIDKRVLPCLISNDDGLYVYQKNGKIFDCVHQKYVSKSRLPKDYQIFCFTPLAKTEKEPSNIIKLIARKFSKYYWQCLLLSFFINLLALSTPLFIIGIYNQVIGMYSPGLLIGYGFGILIAITGFVCLYLLRSQLLVQVGTYIDNFLGQQTLKHILYLPANLIETSSKASQINRLRDFNMVREFLSSQALLFCFDLPFTLIFLIVIAIIGGWLVVFPTLICLLFGALFIYLWFRPNLSLIDLSDANNQQQRQLELLNHLPTIKTNNLIARFFDRLRDLCAKKTLNTVDSTLKMAKRDIYSDALILLSALLLLSFGALSVINGTLSAGALIALVILNWRILGPYKGMYAYADLFKHVFTSFNELNRLMMIKEEGKNNNIDIATLPSQLTGNIVCQKISFRFPGSEYPALNDFNCNINPGELIAVTGNSGSGKSTLLKILLNLYNPSYGKIFIDRQHIYQYPVSWLRQQIAYVPQSFQFIYGTLAQNLRLSNPNASDAALWHVCELAGITEDIRQLPKQFDTRIHDQELVQYSSAFLQGLSLARAWLKHSRIILLDDPICHLDNAQVARFEQYLLSMRGKVTIIMVVHRPSIMQIADRVLLLNQGRLVKHGSAANILPVVFEGAQWV